MTIMRKVLIRVEDQAEVPYDPKLADSPMFTVATVDVQSRIERHHQRVAAEAREKIAAMQAQIRHKLKPVERLLSDATQTTAELLTLAEDNGTRVGDPDTSPPAPELTDVTQQVYPFSQKWPEKKLRAFARKEYGLCLSEKLTRAEIIQRLMGAAEDAARKLKQAETPVPEPAAV
jgi:hypothetical protein